MCRTRVHTRVLLRDEALLATRTLHRSLVIGEHVTLEVRALHKGLAAQLARKLVGILTEVGAHVHLEVEATAHDTAAYFTRVARFLAMNFLKQQQNSNKTIAWLHVS